MSKNKIPEIFHNDSYTACEESLPQKRLRCECYDGETSVILEEVCYIVISHCSSRFAVIGHLVAATLFESSSFSKFEQCFLTKDVESDTASLLF